MAPLSYYWIISFIYLVMEKENFLNRKISDYYPASVRMINIHEIFQAAQLAPIFSFPDS